MDATLNQHRTEADVTTFVRNGVINCAAYALLACAFISGCAPIPYRPSVNILREHISDEEASAVLLKTESVAWTGKIGAELQRAEPRIVFIDGASVLQGRSDFMALSDVIADLLTLTPGTSSPDFVLGLGSLTTEQVHDTNYYVPLVGYTKTQFVARWPASLIELRTGRSAEALIFPSNYSMVVAQLFYGVMIVPMPEQAIHHALIVELLRDLKTACPSGPIRLVVMFQKFADSK